MTTPTPRERAEKLLAEMTWEEKAQQLTAAPATALGSDNALQALLADGIGHIALLQMAGDSPATLAAFANRVQRHLVERTRLGIPAILHNEALSGLCDPGFTAFPTAVGLAGAWRPEAVQEMTDIIRRQMIAVGQRQALSPVLDVARDARWGRVHETYGEDVLLNSINGVHFVRGLQGNDLTEGVLATAKHFLGYAASEGGLNISAAALNPRELYDVYATPFEAAIREAGLQSIMNSYAEVDGIPAGASHEVLTGLLRERMGFTGTVVSDYMTTNQFVEPKKIAATPTDAAALALSAGLDVELPSPYAYGAALLPALRDGTIAPDLVDRAVLRVLEQKFALGLFDRPYVDEEPVQLTAVATEGRELSRELAALSVTLLQTDGTLPLQDTPLRIAVIGPHADSVAGSMANYTYPAMLATIQGMLTGESRMVGVETPAEFTPATDDAADPMAGLASLDIEQLTRTSFDAVPLAEALQAALPSTTVFSVAGCGIVDAQDRDIDAAVRAAQQADLVILAIGGRSGGAGWVYTEGEGVDSARIELPRVQLELVEAVVATGVQCVGIVWMGRPYALTNIARLVPTLLTAYYPGPYGPAVLADVIAGHRSPGGKLPFTLPRETGQVPLHYAQHNGSGAARPGAEGHAGYVDLPATPLFPFGHGLAYTEFTYGPLSGPPTCRTEGIIDLSIEITNTGTRPGDEIVQLYAADTATGVTRPGRQLVGFKRVTLHPGQARRITWHVAASQLGYTGHTGRFVIEPGDVRFEAGSSSTDIRSTFTVDLVGEVIDLHGSRSYFPHVDID